MSHVIEVQDLVHVYPTGVKALKGVSLNVDAGEIIGIIGQNGSGKTTLVRHFNGLLKPTEGKVLINGEDTMKKKVGDLSRHVGYVFQNPNHQIFSSSSREELLVGPKYYKFSEAETKKNFDRVVEFFDLEGILNIHPMTLDYTTKKLLTIASVLISSPDILILDEPTGGLDDPGRKLLSRVIDIMKEQSFTTIIISHDMDYVAENVSRVITMAEGVILKDADPYDTFRDNAVLEKAWIEPPQVTQIDAAVDPAGRRVLNVAEFVRKYE